MTDFEPHQASGSPHQASASPHQASASPRPPGEMSRAEKLAAEWEARHDVAARGHRADPLVVQHYLAHTRTQEGRHRAAAPAGPQPASAAAGADPAARPPWWRRLLGRR